MSRRAKFKLFLGFLGVAALFTVYLTARYFYFYGRETGSRTGYLRMITVEGPPYCKYVSGELVLQKGGEVAAGGETWTFSLDSRDPNSPLVQQLREVEKAGKQTTLNYRRDLNMWWRCAPTEFFVTAVDK